jgi:hypothetical protein
MDFGAQFEHVNQILPGTSQEQVITIRQRKLVLPSIEFPIPVKSFVYQKGLMKVQGETPANKSMKVEVFVAGMYLGEFGLNFPGNKVMNVNLDFLEGSGLLTLHLAMSALSFEADEIWLRWNINLCGQESSDNAKLVSIPIDAE